MNSYLQNDQDYLAAKFHINDSHITQASHLAFLKIQSWKFAMRTPLVGKRYKKEADEMMKQSFFSFVSSSFVLNEEGFYLNPSN
ncbi:MAG TPA: hypothetical protein VM012_12705 [Flavitalea sp.]|nr:hypothetical protein [Flavitalea sp.]